MDTTSASGTVAPAARAAPRLAREVSPAPDTSNTSRASVGMHTKSAGLEEGMKIMPCSLKVTSKFSMPNSSNNLAAPSRVAFSHPGAEGFKQTPVASWNSFIFGFTKVAPP